MKYVKIFDSKMLPCGFVDIEGDMSAASGKYVKVVGTDMQVKGVIKLGEDMTDAEKALLYQAYDANLMLVGVGSASDMNPEISVTITCVPALPNETFNTVIVTFSEEVLIEDFISHVNVSVKAEDESITSARLESQGSGQIGAYVGEQLVGLFRSDGSDVQYSYSDQSDHGYMLYAMEWVN